MLVGFPLKDPVAPYHSKIKVRINLKLLDIRERDYGLFGLFKFRSLFVSKVSKCSAQIKIPVNSSLCRDNAPGLQNPMFLCKYIGFVILGHCKDLPID